MRIACLFPGQGAQEPGMLAPLRADPMGQALLAEAEAVLGRDVADLDDAEALAGTIATQLALLIAGIAAARALDDAGIAVDVVAGHSVGAFAAAVAAGTLAAADALRLVELRGRLMQEAFPTGFGMAVVVGLPARRLTQLVEEAGRHGPLYIANSNAPLQTVVAGADPALDALCSLAAGEGARRAERLAVGVPSHCTLLAPVEQALAAALADVRLSPPRIGYASGSIARLLTDPVAIRADLAGNVARPVRWHDTTSLLHERGVRLLIQAPPGTVLADLAADAFPDATVLAMATAGIPTVAYRARQLVAG